ncbi:cell wall glucanase [Fusarium longipes]|uniref:Cell wall glucanase n=1 Tax=Fusarium longipes TaxID=694270 RepID=A0A395SHG7_9HYPO|nr:cell wall glucanase [Fusarium longipes]
MASTPTTSTDDPLHEPPGSRVGARGSLFKLGDFTRLNSQGLADWASPKTTSHSDSCPALGNFKRLFEQLRSNDNKTHNQQPLSASLKAQPITIPKKPSEPVSVTKAVDIPKLYAGTIFDPITDSEVSGSSDTDVIPAASYSTAASTPPSANESPFQHFDESQKNKTKSLKINEKANSRINPDPKIVAGEVVQPESVKHVLSFQPFKYGPISEIHSNVLSTSAKHESLMGKLVHERIVDSMVCRDFPSIADNGIHVFVDMSNIIIGFQKALRARFGIPESSRFVPLPQMNLPFFHELLTRDRYAEWLNVGCSMRPDRGEPPFIQELKDLGYRVDLRSRRPEQSSSNDHTTFEAGGFRYVEDMVDETLQIRIGESVMQYFEMPGTLVIATGDARPAKYSDGFLAYAQRALRMGWSVEVVSWKASLSSAWNALLKDNSIGSRFRIVELDQFVDELWTC